MIDLGSGPMSSDMLVIGRDFGSEEARLGQPFQGPAGAILNSTLHAAGLRREDVRVDNLVPKQPSGNDWDRHTTDDLVWGLGRLTKQIELQRPKLIVGLGTEVAKFLLDVSFPLDAGIQELRGYLWDTRFGRVLTTVHPAGILRDWTPWRALLNIDMRRAVQELRLGTPALDHRTVTVVTHPRQLQDLRAAIAASKLTACDIENTGDLKLACMGFAPSPSEAWVIPACDTWQTQAIFDLCVEPFAKVLQNGQYDRFFLDRFCGVKLANQVFDTQLAWHSLQPELAGKKLHTSARKKTYSRTTVKSLRFLASIYTRDPFWKSYAFEDEGERYTLCGRDCCVTLDIALKQMRQLEST